MMELMERRRALMVAKKGDRLPAEYQEVTYIRFLNGTRLDLGTVTISDNPTMEIEFLINHRNSYYGPHLIGGDPNALVFIPRTYNNSGVIVINRTTNNIIKFNDAQQYKVSLNGSTLTINNTPYTVAGGASSACHMYIGCYAADPQANNFWFDGYIYGSILIDNKFELVPCYRKSDTVIGMYDLKTKQFFTNAGSSHFEKGPDVQ